MTVLLEENIDALEMNEMHWSTGSVLALFFAVTMVSAVFFGMGYTFGRSGTPPLGLGTGSAAHTISDPPAVHGLMLQVAATGDRSDAGRLARELARKGIAAQVVPGAQDSRLHVELGPFATIRQAEAAQHRLAEIGYRTTLKRE